jgi:hypothetical protein
MSRVLDDVFTKLLAAFPTSYDAGQMRPLWLSAWADFPLGVIVRTVEHVIRSYPTCPSLDEFLNEAETESLKVNRAHLRERMLVCEKCDMGMVETKPDLFRPCEDCLPEGYQRWFNGAYEPTL